MIPRITLTDAPDDKAIKTIAAQISEFNLFGAGRSNEYRPLAVILSDPETAEPIGGLWGWTSFSFLHINLLFVPEQMRKLGLGRQLMEIAEEEAVQRGCRGAWLDTFSFQARGFYERLGYISFGCIEDYPPGHSRYFLKKTLPAALNSFHDQ